MLYLHGGWVRTGTSSLQAALVAHQEELADEGLAYPSRWRLEGRDNHHGIAELLEKDGEAAKTALREFQGGLESQAADAVLLSNEALVYWLDRPSRGALLTLIAAAREIMPVTCIWTLRDIADLVHSMCLRQVIARSAAADFPVDFVRYITRPPNWPEDIFTGLLQVEEAVDDTVYLRYEHDGSHNIALLRAAGVTQAMLSSIGDQLISTPRLNGSLSHKAAVSMLHRDLISTRAGFQIDERALAKLFYRDDFQFGSDRPCTLLGEDVMEELRERAFRRAAQRLPALR